MSITSSFNTGLFNSCILVKVHWNNLFGWENWVIFSLSLQISVLFVRVFVVKRHLKSAGGRLSIFDCRNLASFIATSLGSRACESLHIWWWGLRNFVLVVHWIQRYSCDVFFERSEVGFFWHHVLTQKIIIYRLSLFVEQMIVCTSERRILDLFLCFYIDMRVMSPLFIKRRSLLFIFKEIEFC